MDVISVDANRVYEVLREMLYSCKINSNRSIDTKFYHNTKMKYVPKILLSGLLSVECQAKYDGRELTKEEVYKYSDDCKVNGLNYISLSSMQVDFSKMLEREYVYDPFQGIEANIVISSKVKALQATKNYFNEFLVQNEIPADLFNSIDTKILKILNYQFSNIEENLFDKKIQKLIEYYQYLKDIALSLEENKLNIPLREVSEEEIILDPQKIIKLPNIKIKIP